MLAFSTVIYPCLCRSAPVLPRVDENTRVEHRVHIGAEPVLLLEIGPVHTRIRHVHTKKEAMVSTFSQKMVTEVCNLLIIMRLLVGRRREERVGMTPGSATCTRTLPFHSHDLLSYEFVTNLFLPHAVGNESLDVSRAVLVRVGPTCHVKRLCSRGSIPTSTRAATLHHTLHLDVIYG